MRYFYAFAPVRENIVSKAKSTYQTIKDKKRDATDSDKWHFILRFDGRRMRRRTRASLKHEIVSSSNSFLE